MDSAPGSLRTACRQPAGSVQCTGILYDPWPWTVLQEIARCLQAACQLGQLAVCQTNKFYCAAHSPSMQLLQHGLLVMFCFVTGCTIKGTGYTIKYS